MAGSAIALRDVAVIRGDRALLAGIDWTVGTGERWAVIGPNGSGKTTLLSIASTYLWPTHGSVEVLGSELGRVDARELRKQIGLVSAMLTPEIPNRLTAFEVVLAGSTGATAPWWDRHDAATRARASELLDAVGCGSMAARRFDLLSSGERQRLQIARALMSRPRLLLFDEPAAGLDLGAREALMRPLELVAQSGVEASVLVTHHVEEIPRGTTNALVLREGRAIASGAVDEVITGSVLSEAFGLRLEAGARDGRFFARAGG